MNEKLSIREQLVCRILLVIARIIGKEVLNEEIKKELASIDSRIYMASN